MQLLWPQSKFHFHISYEYADSSIIWTYHWFLFHAQKKRNASCRWISPPERDRQWLSWFVFWTVLLLGLGWLCSSIALDWGVSLSFSFFYQFLFAVFSYISLPLLATYCYLDMIEDRERAVSQRIKDFCFLFVLYLYCHEISENCLDLSH